MPDYPAEALQAAKAAISGCVMATDEELARAALDAAAPVLAAGVARKMETPMPDTGLAYQENWRRSSFHKDGPRGDCVEVRLYGDGVVGLRDARFPTDRAKLFSAQTWAAFAAGVKAGEFDVPAEAPAAGNWPTTPIPEDGSRPASGGTQGG